MPVGGKHLPKPNNRFDLWEYLNRRAVICENTGVADPDETIIWNLTDEPVDRLTLNRIYNEGAGVRGNFVLLLGPPAAGKGFISADGEADPASEIKKRWATFGIDKFLPHPIGDTIEVHEGDKELVKYQQQQKWQDFNDLHRAVSDAFALKQDPQQAYMKAMTNKYYVNVAGQKEMLINYMPFDKFTKKVMYSTNNIRQGMEQMGGKFHPDYTDPQHVATARFYAAQGGGTEQERAVQNDPSMGDVDKHNRFAQMMAAKRYGRAMKKRMKKEAYLYEDDMTPGATPGFTPPTPTRFDPGQTGFRQQRRQAVQDYKQQQTPQVQDNSRADMKAQFAIYEKETESYYASMRSRGQEAAGDIASGKAREGYKSGAMQNFYKKIMGVLQNVSGAGGKSSDLIIVDSPGEDVKKVQEYAQYMKLAHQIGFATSVVFAFPGMDDSQAIEASKAGNFIRGLKGKRMVVPESDIIPFFNSYKSTLSKLDALPDLDVIIQLNKNIPPENIENIRQAIRDALGGRVPSGEIFSQANANALTRQYGTIGDTKPDSPVSMIEKAINKNVMRVNYQASLRGGRMARSGGAGGGGGMGGGAGAGMGAPMSMKKNMHKGDPYPPAKGGKKIKPGDWSDGKTVKSKGVGVKKESSFNEWHILAGLKDLRG